MRIGLFAAGCFTYLGGLGALILAREFALNPAPGLGIGDIPTTGMLIIFALAVIPGVTLIFLGIVLQANPRYKRIDTSLAVAGLAVFLVLLTGSAVVIT